MFSARQTPEGLALWQLLQLPPAGPLGALYFVVNILRGFLFSAKKRILARAQHAPKPLRRLGALLRRWHATLPLSLQISPPTRTMLSQSLMPFTEIVARNSLFVEAALRGKPKIKYQ